MMTAHILIMIHGITPEMSPQSHAVQYQRFWRALQREQPALPAVIGHIVEVEWGNRLTSAAARPDERLSDAQRRASVLCNADNVLSHPSANNVLHPGPFGDWNLIPGMRFIVRNLREQLVQFGLADAVYYASQEGESAVRAAVYGQVLDALRELKSAPRVMLHVVGHSLGVTVAHDFLYGLFGKAGTPDFPSQAPRAQDGDDYLLWRSKANAGQLQLGSFTAMASQLPLFALRKQRLVELLASGGVLDPRDIGVIANGQTQWLIVYDIDDPLGFATRELYGDKPEVRQVQVDAGDTPLDAHTAYWTNEHVISEAAQLIAARAGVLA